MRRAALLLGVLIALLAAGPAAAQSPGLSSYSSEAGVSAKVSGPTLTISFINRSRRAIRAFRGKHVRVQCEQAPPESLLADGSAQSKVRRVKVGKHAKKLKARIPNASKYDLCFAYAIVRKRFYLLSVATTPAGALTLEEATIAGDVSGALDLVLSLVQGAKAPTIDEAVTKLSPLLVALADSSGVPPVANVGYWSDGDQHLVVAAQTPAGRRLFVEIQANRVLSENISSLLVYSLLDF